MSLRLGLIGAGSMGTLHARVATDASDVDLRWVTDPDPEARNRVSSRYGVRTEPNPPSFTSIDALIVASPTHSHAKWCLEAVDAGVPFLVEKPLSTDLREVEEIAVAAQRAGVPFTVGFVERFNPAIRTVEGIIESPFYINAVRHSPYVERIRTGVGGDLMIHDIDLALRLMHSAPQSVTASLAHVHPSSDTGAEDIAEAHLHFEGGGMASISASRAAQRKIRTVSVTDLERTVEVDLMRQDVTIYRHVLSAPIQEDRPGYRQETVMEIPHLTFRTEPLVAQLAHFMLLVSGGVDPSEEVESILLSHRVLEACKRSATEGRSIQLVDASS